MTLEIPLALSFGLIGGVTRGPPPESCIHTCPEYQGPVCGTCVKRPILNVIVDFGEEPSLESAIAKGLTTPEKIEEFRKQITGGN